MSEVIDIAAHRPAPYAAPQQTPTPSSIDAEQALLGALLMNNDVFRVVSQIVEAEHFAEPVHRKTWQIAAGLLNDGRLVSPVTLRTYIGEDDLGQGQTPGQYLARLAAEASSVALCAEYAKHIRDLALRRALIASAGELTAKLASPDPEISTPTVAAEFLENAHAMIATAATVDTRRDLGTAAGAFLDRVDGIRAGTIKDDAVTTGIADLDRDTGGYRPGTLWIVGARPGMGKTGFMTASSRRCAQKGVGVMNLSLEVSEEQIIARHLADFAYRHHRPLSFGQIMKAVDLTDDDLWCLEDARKRLSELPIVLDVAPKMTVAQIAARVRGERKRMAKRGVRLGVVFIDYLKFIKATDRYKGMRVYEVAEITAGLKEIAKEEDLCVVLLAQLNRDGQKRDDKDNRPRITDLRESGDLEADAEVVCMLYRRAHYLAQSAGVAAKEVEALAELDAARHDLEIILAKNRAGPTGTLTLWCDVGASTLASRDERGWP